MIATFRQTNGGVHVIMSIIIITRSEKHETKMCVFHVAEF